MAYPNFATQEYDPYEEFKKSINPSYTAPQNPATFNPGSTGMIGGSEQGYTGPNIGAGQGASPVPSYGSSGGGQGYAPQPSYGQGSYGAPSYGGQMPGPYNPGTYTGGSMRPTNQGQMGPRMNVPGGPTNMPPPPGMPPMQSPVYDPNRPNLMNMPGGIWNVQPQFWNRGY